MLAISTILELLTSVVKVSKTYAEAYFFLSHL